MKEFSDFLSMGGYAFYVWTAYGLALAVLVANMLSPILRSKRVKRDVARLARRQS